MSLVQFLGIYFVHRAGIDVTTVGLAFLCENLARGLLAPMFGAMSDRIGRRALLLTAALSTAIVLPCFLLVTTPASLLLWSLLLGITGAVNMPVASALLLDLAPPPACSPDRKSTRLNSSHQIISYAVFCLKKKKR